MFWHYEVLTCLNKIQKKLFDHKIQMRRRRLQLDLLPSDSQEGSTQNQFQIVLHAFEDQICQILEPIKNWSMKVLVINANNQFFHQNLRQKLKQTKDNFQRLDESRYGIVSSFDVLQLTTIMQIIQGTCEAIEQQFGQFLSRKDKELISKLAGYFQKISRFVQFSDELLQDQAQEQEHTQQLVSGRKINVNANVTKYQKFHKLTNYLNQNRRILTNRQLLNRRQEYIFFIIAFKQKRKLLTFRIEELNLFDLQGNENDMNYKVKLQYNLHHHYYYFGFRPPQRIKLAIAEPDDQNGQLNISDSQDY